MPDQGDGTKNMMEEALNDGQLDPDSDGGPTPATEEAGDGTAGGPTPDSGPTDSDEPSDESEGVDQDTSAEDEETLPEEEAEEQLDESEEADSTADQDQDSEDSGEDEEEDDEPVFVGEHSEYETMEEWREGTKKKDELIYRYRDQLQEERQQKQELRSQVNSLQEAMPQDQRKEMVIQRYMREELPEEDEELLDMSDEELDSDREKQRKLDKARAKAEARFESELEQAEKREKQKLKERRERLNEATEFVTSNVTDDEFNATTAEDRIRLKNFFEEVPEGEDYNRAEKGVLLYADYGPEVAKYYLEGIKQEFVGEQKESVEETLDESDPEPKPQTKPSSDGPDQPEPETEQEFESDSPLETLIAAQSES
jgi:hypothetical protein